MPLSRYSYRAGLNTLPIESQQTFRGTADTIAVWDTALSASEILSLCAYEDPTTIDSPVGVWTFSEEMGSTVEDLSGYGNDGTISGATWTSSCPDE